MKPDAAHNQHAAPISPGALEGIDPLCRTNVLLFNRDESDAVLIKNMLNLEEFRVTIFNGEANRVDSSANDGPLVVLVDESLIHDESLANLLERHQRAEHQCRLILLEEIASNNENGCTDDSLFDEVLARPIRPRALLCRVRNAASQARQGQILLRTQFMRSEQARMWSVLLTFTQSISTLDDLETLLTRIVETASEMTCCRRISLMLPDAEEKHLIIAKAVGFDDTIMKSVRVPIGEAVSGKAFFLGRSIVAQRREDSPMHRYSAESEWYVSLPLVYTTFSLGQRQVGVLNMTERHIEHPFEAWELEFIELLASIAGSSISDLLSKQSIEDSRDSIVIALATLAEYRDNETGLHVERVTRFSVLLAEELAAAQVYRETIDDTFLANIRKAAPLHDIGKVAIPDAILLKPGRLTAEEIEVIRTHTLVGRDTIRTVIERCPRIDFLQMAEDIAVAHHEWFDGSGRGYPFHMAGQAIPLAARIVALADVYDAVTSKRVYKEAMSHEEAVRIIGDASGSQFDPVVVNAFLNRKEDFARLAAELADHIDGEVSLQQRFGRRDVA